MGKSEGGRKGKEGREDRVRGRWEGRKEGGEEGREDRIKGGKDGRKEGR